MITRLEAMCQGGISLEEGLHRALRRVAELTAQEELLQKQVALLEQYVTQCGLTNTALRQENSLLKQQREATHWVGNTTLKVRKLPANLIATEPAPPPPMLFVTVTDGIVTEDGSLQSADMRMVSYACLALLSKELQAQVRAELKALVQPTGDHVVAEKP